MAKSRSGFSMGGSTDSAKKNVVQLNELGKAIRYLSENMSNLTAEERKNAEVVKKANEVNSKASEIIINGLQPAYKYMQKEIAELEEIQKKYNATVKNTSENVFNSTSKIKNYKTKIESLRKEIQQLELEEKRVASDAVALAEVKGKKEAQEAYIKSLEDSIKEEEVLVNEEIKLQKEALEKYEAIYGKRTKILQDSIKDEEKLYNERMSKVDEAFKKEGKLGAKSFKAMEEVLGGIDAHLTELSKMSSLGDLGRGAKSIGESFEKVGATVEAMGGGRIGRSLAGFGGMITKALGPIGMLISIAETLMSAEKEQKDFNKQILEGGGALDYMSKGTDSLHENLNVLRKGMLDYTNLTEMGLGADEVRSTLNSLQEANLTLKKMAPEGANIKEQFGGALVVMKELKTISTVFGLGIDEATSHVETLHMNLGKTLDDAEDMKNIKNAFDSIRDAASQAGYSNKKFFSTIIGVTNEVNSMNGRVAEAGTLFLRLKKLMGKKGEKLFEEAKQGYEGKSFQEKATDVYKVGQGNTKKILEREALTKSISLFGQGGKGGIYGGQQGEEIQKLFKGVGVDIKSLTEGNTEQVAKLSKMSIEDRAKFLGDVRRSQGADVANALQDLFSLAKGAKGGTIGAQTQALDKTSMGGNLAMLSGKLNFIGMTADKIAKIDFTSEVNQKLFEDTFGENANNMRDLMERSRSDYLSTNKLVQEYAGATDKRKLEIDKELGEQGMAMKEGKLIAKGTGLAIGSFTDFIQSFPERFQSPDEVEQHQKTQEELLQESIDATVSSSDVIATILKEKLDFLGDYTSWIFSWLSGGTDREKKIQEQEKLKEEIRQLEKQRADDKDYVNDLKKQMKTVKKGSTEEKALQEKIAEAEAGAKARQTLIEEKQGVSRAFRSSEVTDKGSAENVRRYELAQAAFDEAKGSSKDKYKAVGEKYGDWAVEELKARETLSKSTDKDDKKTWAAIQKGGAGGSAYEILKQKQITALEDKKTDYTAEEWAMMSVGGIGKDPEEIKKIDAEIAALKGSFKTFNLASDTDIGKIEALKEGDKAEAEKKKVEEEKKKKEEEEKKIAEGAQASIDSLKPEIIQKDEEARLKAQAKDPNYKSMKKEEREVATKLLIEEQEKARKKQFEEAFTKFAESKGTNIQDPNFKNKLDRAYTYSSLGTGQTAEGILDFVNQSTAPAQPVQDLLISSKGAFKLDSKDDVVAMKPGGAIDQYMKGKGAGSVTININGGDEARIFEVVKKAMQSAGVVTQGGR